MKHIALILVKIFEKFSELLKEMENFLSNFTKIPELFLKKFCVGKLVKNVGKILR